MNEANDALSGRVIGLAFEVHRTLGPGLLESIYELALCRELADANIKFARQKEIQVRYKGQLLGVGFRVDVLVQSSLVVELKAVDKLTNLHTAQLISYLKILGLKRGLLLNFNSAPLKQGIRRVSV